MKTVTGFIFQSFDLGMTTRQWEHAQLWSITLPEVKRNFRRPVQCCWLLGFLQLPWGGWYQPVPGPPGAAGVLLVPTLPFLCSCSMNWLLPVIHLRNTNLLLYGVAVTIWKCPSLRKAKQFKLWCFFQPFFIETVEFSPCRAEEPFGSFFLSHIARIFCRSSPLSG